MMLAAVFFPYLFGSGQQSRVQAKLWPRRHPCFAGARLSPPCSHIRQDRLSIALGKNRLPSIVVNPGAF
jgi:hypothetical protein